MLMLSGFLWCLLIFEIFCETVPCDENGNNQSPINVMTAKTKRAVFKPFRNVGKVRRMREVTVFNNGHTVKVLPNEETSRAVITSGPLQSDLYKFSEIHFHWGSNDSIGAEHQINNQVFPLEMHMIFYNIKYPSLADAQKMTDGLAVMATLFDVTKRDNFIYDFTDEFTKIIASNSSILFDFGGKHFSHFLPLNSDSYYTYRGSLTTEPYCESVTWIVFSDRVVISSRQLENFRKLKDNGNKPMWNNFREPKDLNGRPVYRCHVAGKTGDIIQKPTTRRMNSQNRT